MNSPLKRRTDYRISVRRSGHKFFFMRWYWRVDHVGGQVFSNASGFAMSEAQAIKKAEKLAHKVVAEQREYDERRIIKGEL